MLITKTANCGVLGDWAKAKGYFHPYSETPKPGDLALFDFSGRHTTRQHVGLVMSASGSTIYTIEGNTSVTSNDNGGAVMRRTRSRSQAVGYVRPPYTASQTAERALAIAVGQVGVKESPAGSNNVKYNTWFYGRAVSGDAYPWCMAFMSWVFAVLAGEIMEGKEETVMVEARRLAKGSTGSAVKKLQILLNGLGYDCGSVDGDFGPKTDEKVRAYQTANGLTRDGVVGAATWGKLIG